MRNRLTPQTKEVIRIVKLLNHATNQQILEKSQKSLPDLTATTVHRITNRLLLLGLLRKGPELNGSITLDTNLKEHDHFICETCCIVKDVYVPRELKKQIKKDSGLPIMPGSLTIYGQCEKCPNGS